MPCLYSLFAFVMQSELGVSRGIMIFQRGAFAQER